MVGEACLPSNAYYPRTPDYTLYSGVHVCWSEHSDSSFVYGFMSLDNGLGTMAATTFCKSPHGASHWCKVYKNITETVIIIIIFFFFFFNVQRPITQKVIKPDIWFVSSTCHFILLYIFARLQENL